MSGRENGLSEVLMGIAFFPAGRGIGHQILVEEGYTFPNTLTVPSDSHINMYGGVACEVRAVLNYADRWTYEICAGLPDA